MIILHNYSKLFPRGTQTQQCMMQSISALKVKGQRSRSNMPTFVQLTERS